MAAAEAIASGVPVLVSPNTGIAEIIRRHACGVVVRADAAAIADQLKRLRNDPGALDDLAAKAGDAAAELSLDRHGDQLKREYEQLCRNALHADVSGHARVVVTQ
jgi:glycosyltransferase involved in cell wall biosynthesis